MSARRERDDRDDVGRADPRMDAVVAPQVDPSPRASSIPATSPSSSAASSPTSVKTARLWSASTCMSSTRAPARANASAIAATDRRVAPFGDVRHGLEQGHRAYPTTDARADRSGVLRPARARVRRLVPRPRALRGPRPRRVRRRARRRRARYSPTSPRRETLDVACGTGFLTRHLRGEITGLDQSARMLEVARAQAPRRRRSSQGDALALPFADDTFDRVFSGHFYGHLDEAQRAAFLREARRVAPELVIVGRVARALARADEEWSERVLSDGSSWQVYKRWFAPGRLLDELGGGEVLLRRPLVRRRALAAVSRAPLDRLAPARQRALPAVPRGGVPDRPAGRVRRPRRPARVPLRARPGPRRGGDGLPWQGRAGRTLRRWLAARRGRVLRALLLRLGHALLPRPEPGGRGDRRATRARRLLALRGASASCAAPPRAHRHGRPRAAAPLLGVAALTDAVGKSYVLDDAVAIPLPHPSGASGWLNDRTNRARLGKALTHVRRELARHGRIGSGP